MSSSSESSSKNVVIMEMMSMAKAVGVEETGLSFEGQKRIMHNTFHSQDRDQGPIFIVVLVSNGIRPFGHK